MKFLFIIFLLGVISLTICGCGDDNNVNQNNYDVLIPLKVGNYWINTHTKLNPDGTVSYTRTDTTNVIEMQKMNSEEVYHLLTQYDWYGSVAGEHAFYFNKPDGLYTMGLLGDDAYFPELIFKFPIKQGEEFSVYDTKKTLLSSNRLTKVPAGEFSCYVYESKFIDGDKFYKNIHHYAPNIGLVYFEQWESPDLEESHVYLSWYSFLEGYKLK